MTPPKPPQYPPFLLSILIALGACTGPGCRPPAPTPVQATEGPRTSDPASQEPDAGPDGDEAGDGEASVWNRVTRLYEEALESGERAPGEVADWVRSDLQRIGTWQYRVVFLEDNPESDLETALNELGAERWEVFWMEHGPEGYRFFCRKPHRSYLRLLPAAPVWGWFSRDNP